MIMTSNYKILHHENRYYVVNNHSPICPDCACPLKVHDSRRRKLITDTGEVLLFNLRRLRCPKCSRLHLELPDIMQRYKHYSRDVIARALDGAVDDCPADDSTIYRWKHETPTA